MNIAKVYSEKIVAPVSRWYPWLYLAGVAAAEVLVSFVSVWAGILLHLLVLVLLLLQSSFAYNSRQQRFCLAIMLAPIIRLTSLMLPMANIPLVFRYLVVSLPIFLAAFAVARLNGYRAVDICLSPGRLWLQLLIALSGIPLGLVEYFILRSSPVIPVLTPQAVIVPALIMLVSTGFLEELVFRGIIQKAALDLMGEKKSTFLFICLFFTVMHMIHLSFWDLWFVFAVAVFFSLTAFRTRSILGVTLAHGINNIVLYLYAPFIFHLTWAGGRKFF